MLICGSALAARPDGYILSLSWAPQFCADDRHAENPECVLDAGFILHGLWPEPYDRHEPDCATDQRVAEATIEHMLPIMPSRGLIIHEWHKHGACTGLAPDAYFALAERAFRDIRIPISFVSPRGVTRTDSAAIKRDFANVNPQLHATDIELSCGRGQLLEVRICLTATLTPNACPAPEQNRCDGTLIVQTRH